jgi:hypothetical protein
VKTRLINALIPLKFTEFYKEYAEKPDLYGPTWVLATLVCFLFITGNIQRYAALPADRDFRYHFKVVPIALILVFGVGFGIPLLMKLALKFFGKGENETPTAQTVGIFGYSFTSFLIPVLICAAPYNGL